MDCNSDGRLQEHQLPIVMSDEWLRPVEGQLNERWQRYCSRLGAICDQAGSLVDYANGHLYYGFHYDSYERGWWFREWLPGAQQVYLYGDFNDWEHLEFPLTRDEWGVWSVFISDERSGGRLGHESLVKMHLLGADDRWVDKIPSYIRRAVQDGDTGDFKGQVWCPSEPFDWQGDDFDMTCLGSLMIYECHVGMSSEREGVSSYAEFTRDVLPRVKRLGYNTVQLMAVAEHPYYGSFGYHVSNLFAPSSRFGTPDDLKELIRTAHNMGIGVVMDVVHSHFVKNTQEGLNRIDGTDLYSMSGVAGDHPHWDSKLYNYGREEVQHMLLSNLKYWIEEFHFDGFRFDGVSSMIYYHHGYADFDSRDKFFNEDVNLDAMLYLTLANRLVHDLRPSGVTIAEDVSGMPGMAVSISDGGVGFDYRLAMAIPDFWIRYLKEVEDHQWDLWEMWSVMTNRLPGVRTVAYCESHDQALVGDKTIAFRLMDKEMYWSMGRGSQNLVVDRGIALHKMIRLLTITLGGNAYMNFMGNEFGHPEWIDFPRAENGWSYARARRQWSLVENPELRYADLERFDKAMVALVKNFHILRSGYAYNLLNDNDNKTMVFEHGGLVFVMNWHPTASVMNYRIPVPVAGKYRIVLNSDGVAFGGFARLDPGVEYFTESVSSSSCHSSGASAGSYDSEGEVRHYLSIYNISRAALVFEHVQE